MLLADVREVRRSLDEAKTLIGRIKDKGRRSAFEIELADARIPLREAVESAHMFVFEPMQERLLVARKRADMLTEALANPSAPSGK